MNWNFDCIAEDPGAALDEIDRLQMAIRNNWMDRYSEGTVCNFCGVAFQDESQPEPFPHKDDCVVPSTFDLSTQEAEATREAREGE